MLQKSLLRRPGFTLVELLTVIAIIGVLTAILIPAVGRVRATAKTSQCTSNLRQWGVGLEFFSQEHRGGYPNPWMPANDDLGIEENTAWTDVLVGKEYISKQESYEILNCPNTDVPAASYSTCYGMNRALARWNEPLWYKSRFINPANTIILGDVGINYSWGEGSGGSTIAHPDGAANAHSTLDFREIGNTANLLFGDGHVEAVAKTDVTKQMFEPYKKLQD